MSSHEVTTKVESDLPQGTWTVILRLAGVGDTPLPSATGDFLGALVPVTIDEELANRRNIESDPGASALYISFDGQNGVSGMPVLEHSIRSVLQGAHILDLELEISARMDYTDQVSPFRQLQDTYAQYMLKDVTQDARDLHDELKDESFSGLDFHELEHLLGR